MEPDHAAETAEARFFQELHLGHVAALVRQDERRASRARHRRRTAGALLGDGAGRHGRYRRLCESHRAQRQNPAAENREPRRDGIRVAASRNGATRSNATARAPISRPMRRERRFISSTRRWREVHAGRLKTWNEFKVPEEAISCGFHEAVRGVLSHHMVIREGPDRELPSLSADALERQPARFVRHAGAVRGRGDEHAHLRGKRRRTNSRASTSCARCGASIPACPAASTCMSATARSSRRGMRRSLARTCHDRPSRRGRADD